MTEEGGGGDLGTLEVGVVGDASGIDAVLSAVEKRLNELVSKEYKVTISGQETVGTGTPSTAPTGGGNKRPARDPVKDRAAREEKARIAKEDRDATLAHAEDLRRRRETRKRNATGDQTYVEPLKPPRKYTFKEQPATPAPTPASAKQDVKPEKAIKFNTDVRKDIEADLAEPFELKLTIPEIDIKINKEFLREQVVSAFSDLVIDVKANAQVGGVSGSPASASQGGGTPVAREWSAGVREMVKKNAGVEDAIHGLYTQLKAHAPESAPFTRDDGDKDALGKLDEIAQRFGVTTSRLVETFYSEDQPGGQKKGSAKTGAARLAEGPLGTTALKAAGFDAAGAKAVAMQATVVQKLASASSLMSDFVEESRQQPRQQKSAERLSKLEPLPNPEWERQYERHLAHKTPEERHAFEADLVATEGRKWQTPSMPYMGEDAPSRDELYGPEAKRPISETPTAEARAPRAVFKAAEDFVDHIRAMAGDINPANIPNTQNVMVPASIAKEGELPREALQAAKKAAGRSEGTQGGLGDIDKILALASRATGSDPSGAFRDYAYELDKPGGKRTGKIIKYDPGYEKEDHPFYDPLTRKQRDRAFFGTTPVEKANPAELLQTALKALFPGIEVQKTPGDPMSSLLGRVMAGPAPGSLAAQPSIPGDRGAGGYAPGVAKSLRESQQDTAKAMAEIRAALGQEAGDAEIQRRMTTAAKIDKQVTGPQSRRRNARSVTEQAKQRREEGEYIRSKIASGALPGKLDSTGTRIETAGYVDLMAKIAESNLPLRNTINKQGGFDKGAINTALQPVDEAMYDRLGLTGGSRNPKALDRPEHYYVGAERSALINTIYKRNRQAEQDLDRRPDGIGGRRPEQVVGQRVTGKQTSQGEIEQVPEYARPATANDRRVQEAQAKLGRDATEARQKELATAADEALRRTQRRFSATRKPSTAEGEGVDVLSFRSSSERGEAGRFYDRSRSALERPIKARQSEEIASTVSQIQHYHAVKLAADRFLKSIAAVGTTLTEVDGNIRRVGEPDVEKQRSIAKQAQLINLPEGVTQDEVRAELKDVLDFRAAGVARTPKTKNAREPLTSDQEADIFEKAGGLRRPPKTPEPPFAGYNRDLQMGGGGRGVGVNNRGRFQPGGAPIEVIVVGRFPLPVEITGGSSAAAGAREDMGPGKRRKNINRIEGSEPSKKKSPAAAGPMGPTEPEGFRYGGGARKTREEVLRERQEQMYAGLFKQIEDQEKVSARASAQMSRPVKMDRSLTARERLKAREQRTATAESAAPFTEASVEAKRQEALGRKKDAAKRQQEAENKRVRRAAQLSDPVGFATEQDNEDKAQRELRGKLRSLNRKIPRRGFGASLTDLVSSIAPGSGSLERQLEAGDLANREATEINRVSTQRAQTRTALKGTRQQIASVQAGPQTQETAQRLSILTALEKDQIHTLGQQNTIIAQSTKRFGEFHAEATKGTTVLRSFGAAAAGGAIAGGLGVLQFALGGALIAPITAAVSAALEVGGTAVERVSGNAATAGRVQTELGGATRQAGGRSEIAFAQARAETGLGPRAAALIEEPITQRAQIEAGNQALIAQVDQFRASQKFRDQNKDYLGDAALSKNLTGFLGNSIGGTPSAEESITNLFQDVPSGFKGQSGPTAEQLAEQQNRQRVVNELQASVNGSEGYEKGFNSQRLREAQMDLDTFTASIGRSTDALDGGAEALDFFNKQAEDAGANIRVAPGGGLDPADRQKQVQALFSARLNRLAEQVKNEQISITDAAGKAELDPQKIVDELTKYVTASPKPSPDALLTAQKDQIKAQIQTAEAMSKLTLDTLLPASRGIASAGEGDIKLGDRLDLGATPENRAAAAEQNRLAKVNRQAAIDFVRNGPPELQSRPTGHPTNPIPGENAGLGADKADQFATALNKAAGYSNQINDIQLGVQVKQAALAADQYSYSIGIAKRSLQDAKALIGDIAGGTNNLGAIERQNFLLQRQSQTLGLELSQRQINFQRAIANFQAPGLSSEEREARKQAAKIEADFAQKQLDIQKKLFALAGQSFDVQGRRSVDDQIGNIGLMERGRKIVIDTADAEAKIADLSKKRDKELATVQSIFQTAVDQTQYIIGLSGQMVAATGKDMGELANHVIQAYAKVYNGLIANANESLANLPYQGGSAGYGGKKMNALGSVGMVNGATAFGTSGVMGEAGGEAYAILRDPQKLNLNPYDSGSGGTHTTIINVTGNTVRNDGDLDEIARKVERVMNTRGAQLGLRPLGS